ncbi:ABC transporter substrate-binding protein [Microcella alkaliphila]|uniref:Family 1 extracellular solute-binding protein n=1 Tax=Microcella alkaliphila TaxID=279828 RepID=A0A0U4NYW6_9MICO|nr:sugar ABC transporter substrate-binding protein [Microcella alkaliphila]BAU33395.1 Family 1 extracellular solute-binding protein [Microcella alkaliphila]
MKKPLSRPARTRAIVGVTLASALIATGCAAGTPESSGDQVTLNAIFLPATWGTVVAEQLAPQYEEETGVRVNVELIGRDAIYERMATLFASQDSSYDIFNLDYNWIPDFGTGGHLVALDSALTPEDREDFLPLALDVSTWDGELLGIPQTVHPAVLWYNSALYADEETRDDYLAETGVELAPPATMDEWLQQVVFFDGRVFEGQELSGWAAQAARGFGNVHTWLSFAFSYDCKPFNDDYTESTLSTPECIEATERWAEMMQYMPAGANEFTYDNVTAAAQQGTIATAVQWSWGQFAVDDPSNSQTVGQWDVVEMPEGPRGTSAGHLAAWTISVSKYSENIDEAIKFVTWLQTQENDVFQASNGAGDPVRISSYSSPELLDQTLEGTDVLRFRRLPVVLDAMQTAQPRPLFPGQESWETVLSTELSAISLGQRSVEEGLARADETQNRAFSQ